MMRHGGGWQLLVLVVAVTAIDTNPSVTSGATNTTEHFRVNNSSVASNTTAVDECSDIKNIVGCDQQCAVALSACAEHDARSLIPYNKILWCANEKTKPYLYIIFSLEILILLELLSSTAEIWFMQQLEYLSASLGLSAPVAGVTLLSFGNGAPDVFTAISAIMGPSCDFALVLSELLGACAFITSIVLGMVILRGSRNNKSIKISIGVFCRNATILGISLSIILGFTIGGEIQLWEALALLCFYIIYVVFVVVTQTHDETGKQGVVVVGTRLLDKDGSSSKFRRLSHLFSASLRGSLIGRSFAALSSRFSDITETDEEVAISYLSSREESSTLGENIPLLPGENSLRLTVRSERAIPTKLELFYRPTDSRNAAESIVRTCVWAVEWPFTLIRHSSIPAADFLEWNGDRRFFAMITPVFGPLIAILSFGGKSTFQFQVMHPSMHFNFPAWVLVVPLGIVCGVLVKATTNNSTPPGKATRAALVILAFLVTIAWLNLLADELVALLSALGASLGLSTAILGLTVLSWGNCVGDFVADFAAARVSPRMAIASCFGSPLFSQVFALGVPVALYSLSHGGNPVPAELNPQAKLSFLFVGLIFTSSVVAVATNGGQATPKLAYFLFALYTTYLVLSISWESGMLPGILFCT